MKKQGSATRDQVSENMTRLLRNAIPPIGENQELSHDLWPAMQQLLLAEKLGDSKGAGPVAANRRGTLAAVPWFDWALAGAIVLFAVASPVSIPVLLYYL